jgi:hypothetical protein
VVVDVDGDGDVRRGRERIIIETDCAGSRHFILPICPQSREARTALARVDQWVVNGHVAVAVAVKVNDHVHVHDSSTQRLVHVNVNDSSTIVGMVSAPRGLPILVWAPRPHRGAPTPPRCAPP